MKPTIIPTLLALALLAASCGGGNNTQTQGGNATDTVNNAAPQPVAYKYVEPKDTIAKTIWNAIKTEEPEVAKNIALAVKLNHIPQSKAENYKSKTYLEYLYEIPNEDCHDNPLYARYHIQCYQTLDSSWVAVIDELVHGEKLKGEKISRFFTAHYKDGKITFPPNSDYFTKGISIAENYHNYVYDLCTQFENTGLSFTSQYCWPLQYQWNGKTFDLTSKLITGNVDTYQGTFKYDFASKEEEYRTVKIGEKETLDPGNVIKDEDGNILAKFDVIDGKVEGYTVVSPSCGVVQNISYKTGNRCIGHQPIALGFPIKNALDYEKYSRMKDTAITQGMQDGKYVITQHLAHDERGRDSRDIFIEYTAKDENSPIESIRVYTKKFNVALIDKVNEATKLSPKVKEIFKALHFDENAPEYGGLSHANIYDQNGFEIITNNKQLRFQTYNTDVEGKYLAVLADNEYDRTHSIKFWYYENGQLTPADIQIPKPDYDKDDIRYDFIDGNSVYCMYHWGCDEESEYDSFETLSLLWNGKQFVKEEE